jgi:ABC-2 type transport system ATP-binding protein
VSIIEIEGLKKEYRRLRGGRTVALNGLDLSVPEGGVFGFLGPNGSGKTTTIRCLLGLVRSNAGRCRILGVDPQGGELAGVIRRIGSIVETPVMFPAFSGRRNLELLGRLHGVDDRRISEILERVGLAARAKHKVKTYSLGMRQRLGIGAALLKDPDLLILDEPANGLDPAGIKEVRELLRSLGSEGKTVFVSSHLLSEVRQTCDRVAILSRGRCVAAGPVTEVLAAGGATGVLVRLEDLDAGMRALQQAGMDAVPTDGFIRVALAPADASKITKVLAERGLYVSELRPDEQDLESLFLKLTEEQPEGSPK